MRRYFIQSVSIVPKVYYRLTDIGLELTVRFLSEDRGVREVKDGMSREILREFEAAGITLASATLEVVSVPPLRIAPLGKNLVLARDICRRHVQGRDGRWAWSQFFATARRCQYRN